MRIALYHNLPSGGALGYFCEVAKALHDAGHTLALFSPGTAEQEFGNLKSYVDHEMVFYREEWKPFFPVLNPLLYRTYLGSQLTNEKYYVKHIMEFKPDLIYMGQCRLWTEPPLLRYLPKEIPKVVYCNEPKRSFYEERFIKEREKWPIWKKLWRLPTIEWMKSEIIESIKYADRVFCNSNYSKNYISKAYPGIEPVFAPIGVDCELFKPKEANKVKRQLISVGALDPSKNHDMAIKVAAECPKSAGFKVIIVTDRSYGDTAEHLKNLAQSHEVELEIKVRVPIDELVQIYSESFATIYCPILEPFGRVSIESQACGTPVLGRNEGGVMETVVSGRGGEKFGEDPKDYANELKRWIEEPEVYKNYRLEARQQVLENWNQTKTIKNQVTLLEEIFSNSSKKV